MRGTLALLPLLLGCPGPGPQGDTDDPVRNGLRVVLDAQAGEGITYLMATVDEVVLEADGPNGPVSVGTANPQSADLLRESISTVLDLEAGPYRDVTLGLELAGSPAFELQADVEGRMVTVRIDEPVRLEARVSCLVLADGPDQEVVFLLEPDGWLDELDTEGLEPSDGPALIDARQNSDAYADVLDALTDTEATLDGQGPNDCE